MLQPEWFDSDRILVLSDQSGWWQPHVVDVAEPEKRQVLCSTPEEFGGPLHSVGSRWHAPLADGRIAVLHGRGDQQLGVLDPRSGVVVDMDSPVAHWRPMLAAADATLVGVGLRRDGVECVVRIDVDDGTATTVRTATSVTSRDDLVSESRACRGRHGGVVPAHVHLPAGDVGRPVPFIVNAHGGPTGHTPSPPSLETRFFTGHGFGVVEVNYAGSTGYGRNYRDRLGGHWGVSDVDDCVDVVTDLVQRGIADRDALFVRGKSAGGWTTLVALASTELFRAGTAYCAVVDPAALLSALPDYEKHYFDWLLGPHRGADSPWHSRAPVTTWRRINVPLLLVHGTADQIVPVHQSRSLHLAMCAAGRRCALLELAGEGHALGGAQSIATALRAELELYRSSDIRSGWQTNHR